MGSQLEADAGSDTSSVLTHCATVTYPCESLARGRLLAVESIPAILIRCTAHPALLNPSVYQWARGVWEPELLAEGPLAVRLLGSQSTTSQHVSVGLDTWTCRTSWRRRRVLSDPSTSESTRVSARAGQSQTPPPWLSFALEAASSIDSRALPHEAAFPRRSQRLVCLLNGELHDT